MVWVEGGVCGNVADELTWASWFSGPGLGRGGLLRGTWLSVCSVLLISVDFRRWAGGLVAFTFFLPRESVDFLTLAFSKSLRGDSTSSGNTC